MSMYALPKSQRRLAAILILLAGLAIPVALLAMAASMLVFDQNAKVQAVEERLSSLRAVSGSVEQLQELAVRLESDPRYSRDLYPPMSDAQSTAALQSTVQKAVSETGAKVRSILALDAVADGPVQRVGVRIVMTADSNELNRSIEAISAARPLLQISAADIRLAGASRRDPNTSGAPVLQATFEVFAFVRKS